MPELQSLVLKVRSKNAGPFWLTFDIFCGNSEAFDRVRAALDTATLAQRLGVDRQLLKRFEIPSLNVLKVSIPRPAVQGTRADRDMHGAGLASVLAEMDIS